MSQKSASIELLPNDEHNQKLISHVHPSGWKNPEPQPSYNMVVIGGGTAGLVTAAATAGLGGKVALVEKHLLGGDCLNLGCVPSKALIRSAKAIADLRRAEKYGVKAATIEIDFPAIMERMRKLRADISPHDSAERFKSLGVDLFLGSGKFTSDTSIEVDGITLNFSKAVIATGARVAELPIPGLKETGYLTNESIFSLTELPTRLAVIGAGPIGCELAQCFARFGAKVSLIETMPQILIREDKYAAKIVQQALLDDEIELILDAQIQQVKSKDSEKVIIVKQQDQMKEIIVDEILVGVGRAPNVDGLGLETVGVKFDSKTGVEVNDKLQTTNSKIYAAGDICSPYKFTHTADAMARIVVRNALFKGRSKVSALTIPWCTFTDPEIAHVGLYEHQAKEKGIEIETFEQSFDHVDRAILESETEGFVKVHVKKGTDQIVGATIVATHAGEMISELTLAMVGKLGLSKISETIHPYPTQADAIKKIGDAYSRTRLTPLVKTLFNKWLAWTR